MKYDMDEMMRELYQKEIKPDDTLNQRTLRKMKESGTMNKSGYLKKTVVAAAVACAVFFGGMSAYAAVHHTTLLSLFQGESSEIQNTAGKLIETDISQKAVSDKEQKKYATFSVREAICDKNSVNIQVAITPAKDDYLLVPSEFWSELDTLGVKNLMADGVGEKDDSIRAYANKAGKKCIRADARIESDADSQGIEYMMESDGTLVYTFTFENTDKKNKLMYVCDTFVYASEDGNEASLIRDSFDFTLEDKSGTVQTVHYVPDKKEMINGTQLVLDSIDFEKSALEMKCRIKYHFPDSKNAKNWDKWLQTDDADVMLYLLDENGEIVDFKEGYIEPGEDKGTIIQTDIYSLQKLPDSLTFLVKNFTTKAELGTVTVSKK